MKNKLLIEALRMLASNFNHDAEKLRSQKRLEPSSPNETEAQKNVRDQQNAMLGGQSIGLEEASRKLHYLLDLASDDD